MFILEMAEMELCVYDYSNTMRLDINLLKFSSSFYVRYRDQVTITMRRNSWNHLFATLLRITNGELKLLKTNCYLELGKHNYNIIRSETNDLHSKQSQNEVKGMEL